MLWGMSAQRRATYHLMRGTGATTGVKMDGRWTPKPCKWMQPICHAHTRGQLCCTLQAQSATSAVLWVKGQQGSSRSSRPRELSRVPALLALPATTQDYATLYHFACRHASPGLMQKARGGLCSIEQEGATYLLLTQLSAVYHPAGNS